MTHTAKLIEELRQRLGRMRQDQILQLFVWDDSTQSVSFLPDEKKHQVDDFDLLMQETLYEKDKHIFLEAVARLQHENNQSVSLRLLGEDGTPIWTNLCLFAQWRGDERQQIAGCLSSLDDEHRAVDPMNGLTTQAQLHVDCASGFAENRQGYVIVFDLDDFRLNMETYGGGMCAQLLELMTRAMRDTLPSGTRLYRMEYDRFAAVVYDMDEEAMLRLYATAREKFAGAVARMEGAVYATFSCGGAHFPHDSLYIEDLLRFARSALNTAKLAGKNTMVIFSRPEYDRYQRRQGLLADLRRSIQSGFEGFEVHYQPQIDLQTGRIHGAEALLRWLSSDLEIVSPAKFIPVLEHSGMIVSVGRWVMEAAIRQCRQWRKIEPSFTMSVNIASRQLEKDNLVELVSCLLDKYELPGHALVLELTESEKLRSIEQVNEMLGPLTQLGVAVAIDDFGTGYSSLGYFKELRTNQVKIDRIFMARIRESEYDYKLVEFIISMAHSAGMQVCVEGVETAEELQTLVPLAPQLVQGFYFGRPVTPVQFEQLYLGGGTTVETLAPAPLPS